MSEFVRLAVAMNQGDLALVKCALEGRVNYYILNDHATSGEADMDRIPVYVAEDQVPAATEALKDFSLDHLLSSEF